MIYPSNWSGPILIRGGTGYLRNIDLLISRHSTRVAHNALIVLFTLSLLPENVPTPEVCTRATMWAMPEVASAFFTSQYSDDIINDVIERVSTYAAYIRSRSDVLHIPKLLNGSTLNLVHHNLLFNTIWLYWLYLGWDNVRGAEISLETGSIVERSCFGQIIPIENQCKQLAYATRFAQNRGSFGYNEYHR